MKNWPTPSDDVPAPRSMSLKKIIIIFGVLALSVAAVVLFAVFERPEKTVARNDIYEHGNDGPSFRLTAPSVDEIVNDVTMEVLPGVVEPITTVKVFDTEKTPTKKPPAAPQKEAPKETETVPSALPPPPAAYEISDNILQPLQTSSTISADGTGQALPVPIGTSSLLGSDPQQQFLAAQQKKSQFILGSTPEPILSDTVISAGTTIPISFSTGINSSTPGEIVAIITQDVYATHAPDTLMIPRGSKLLGTYQTSVTYGTERALVAWSRLMRDDGISIDLQGMQSVDLSGYAGIPAKVDNHWDKILGGLLVATVLNIGSAEARRFFEEPTLSESLSQSFGATVDTTQDIANRFIDRAMNIPPHLRVEAGTPAYLFVRQDIYLPPYKEY